MNKYKTLLFDLDDTLLDFGAAEKVALRLLFEEHQWNLTPEIEANYRVINQGLWKQFEDGTIERSEVLNTRFSTLLKEYGHIVDGTLLENSYRRYLEDGKQFVDGAFELVKNIQNHFDLYIVTNGDSLTQYKRLSASGLQPIFKDIFVSEDTGFQKPMKEYFDYVFERIPNFNVNTGLIIGDSLNADIKGGQQAGLDTCWFNPHKKQNDTDLIPTYEIQNLDELYQILQVNKRVLV
ncbi:YjjG family noncanonical pyrimidine nucleotidase [Bacillus sp. JJ664]